MRIHTQVRHTIGLEASLDGVTFSRTGLMFTYYSMRGIRVLPTLTPNGGPHLGGTTVSVSGTGFADYGAGGTSHGLQCHFGRPGWMVKRARLVPRE